VAGQWRISRSGSNAAPLAFSFTLTGTATAGDYSGIPANLSFAAGEATKLVTLTPVDDAQVEGAEQAVFTLAAGAGYTIDATRASGTVTIADNDVAPVQGLSGSYYDNRDFTGLKFTRVDPGIQFNWGTDSPDARIARDTFSVRWQGQLQAVEAGRYTLRTLSDDGVRVRVSGVLRINNWTIHRATYNTSSTFTLAAGQKVTLQVDYFDNTGAATIRLEWKRPGSTSFVAIPASQLLSPAAPAVAASATGQARLAAASDRNFQAAEGEAAAIDAVMARDFQSWTPTDRKGERLDNMQAVREQAIDMLMNPSARSAFPSAKESDSTRDRDGDYVLERPDFPENVAAALDEEPGIKRSKPVYTAADRHIFLAGSGRRIDELF